MEEKKLLLIILSVSVFVALVLGLGLFLFYPRSVPVAADPAATADAFTRTDFDPIEWVRTREDFPALTPGAPDTEEDVIIVYGEQPARDEPPVAVPAVPERQPAPVQPRPIAPAAPVARPAPPPPPARRAPERTTVRAREFTIQVGSFTDRDRAEQAAISLRERGLTPAITSRTVNDVLYYRLRIGPYGNRAEAEKFLTWIREIRGFEESLIFENWVTRTVTR